MSSSNGPSRPAQYFEERKKGEMNELKNLLNSVINDNDSKKGREVVRKAIGYMTLGMDASPVFSEMCRASFINDEVIKKMIYFYLTTYAEDNPDLAIMAVNTFKKDCKNSSPKVRGLALRNLCSFRSSDYVNTVLPVIQELMEDFEPYVKKTAIMGLLKVFYHDPAVIINDQLIINNLSQLIKDADSLVSVNAILALDQILISEGGIPLNSKLYFYLLNRLKEYNEWHQSSIIDILRRYTPESDQQHYNIMNILWQKLKHSSTPLVLGSIRIIIKLASIKPDLFKVVVERIKAPLLTLMTGNQNSGNFETTYIVLQHIQYVIEQMNGKLQYETDFKYFYCKNDEPTYIKKLKVRILGLLANQFNLGDMLNELNDYATDIDLELARKSARTLAEISIQLPEVSKALMINMVSLYKHEKEHLASESMICFYIILRKYPKLFSEVKSSLLEHRHIIKEDQALTAFIWILGTFSQHIQMAPYILEEFLENEDQFQAFDDSIKETLLTQIVQCFLKRPPETKDLLGRIFRLIFYSESTSVLLQDHAAFYYRALQDNVQQVKKNFQGIQGDMVKYQEEKLNLEGDIFNTLGLIYKQKESKFIKNYEHFITMRSKELGLIEETVEEPEGEEPQQLMAVDQIDILQNEVDLEEELDTQHLSPEASMAAEEFELNWSNLQNQAQLQFPLVNSEDLDQESVQELFKMWRIFSMASGEQEDTMKFFMYMNHLEQGYICIELRIEQRSKLFLTTKAKNDKLAQQVNQYVRQFMVLNQFAE